MQVENVTAEPQKGIVPVSRNRSFQFLIGAQFISNIGDAMHSLALIWLMNLLTGGNALWMAMIPVMQLIPTIVLGPFSGVLVDRWPKLRTMRSADVLSAVLAGCIALFALLHQMQPVLLLVLTFMLSAVSTFFGPSKQVLLTLICPKEELMKANAASQTASTISTLGGPIVAGILIGVVGPYLVFALNAVSFMASFLLLAFIRVQEERHEQQQLDTQQFFREMGEGLQVIRRIDVVRASIPIALSINFLFAPMTVFMTKMVTDVFHGGAQQLSYIESGAGVGMLIGSLLIGAVAKKVSSGVIFFVGLFGSALGLLGFSLTHSLWVGVSMIVISCIFNVMLNLAFFTVMQKQVPSDKMGRVSGLLQTVFQGSQPLASFGFGLVLNLLVINQLLFVLSLVFLAINCYGLTKQSLRQMQ